MNNKPSSLSWEEYSRKFDEKSSRIARGEFIEEPVKRPAQYKENREIERGRIPIKPRKTEPRQAVVKPIRTPVEQEEEREPSGRKKSDPKKKRPAFEKSERRPVARPESTPPKKEAKKASKNKISKANARKQASSREPARSKDDERRAASLTKKKKKIKNRVRNTAVAVILALIVGITLCLFVSFKTKSIVVEGESRYSETEIISASGIEPGSYIWRINEENVDTTVGKILPYIGDVKVSVRLPSTVKLIVTEATEKYAMPYSKNYILLSEEGKVLSRTEKKVPKGCMELTGISFADIAIGSKISLDENNEKKLDLAQKVTVECEQQQITPLTALNVENPSAVYTVFDGRVKLYFGNENNLSEKIRAAAALLNKLSSENKNFSGVANLSNDGKVFFLPGSVDAEVTSAAKYEIRIAAKNQAGKKAKK